MHRRSVLRMLWRGARRRCPWCCGRGGCFTGWFAKAEHCQSCGLRWRRDDVGYELGAVTMSVILTFVPLLTVLGVVLALTWPEVHAWPVFIALVVPAVVLPVLIYAQSYLMWQAIDIAMRPPDPGDFEIVADPTLPEDSTPADPC